MCACTLSHTNTFRGGDRERGRERETGTDQQTDTCRQTYTATEGEEDNHIKTGQTKRQKQRQKEG